MIVHMLDYAMWLWLHGNPGFNERAFGVHSEIRQMNPVTGRVRHGEQHLNHQRNELTFSSPSWRLTAYHALKCSRFTRAPDYILARTRSSKHLPDKELRDIAGVVQW